MQLVKLIFQNVVWKGLYVTTLFIINIIIARYFKATESGWIFLTINNLSFVILILSLSLESGMTYYCARREISPGSLSSLSVAWSLLASGGFTFFLSRVGGFLPHLPISSNVFYGMVFCYTFGYLLIVYFGSLFGGFKEFRIPNIVLTTVNLILISILLLHSMKVPGQGPKRDAIVLGFYFCSFAVQGLLCGIAFANRFLNEFMVRLPSFRDIKRLLIYSKLALLINIIFFLVYRVDYWFVARYCTSDQLGNYIQVSKIAQVFLMIPSMIATVIFPLTAAELKDKMSEHLPIVARLLFWVYLVLLALLIVTGDQLFSFIYGNSYYYMYPVFLLLVPGILALSIQALLTAYYAGRNLLINNLKGALIALAIIVPGDVFIIPRYGINGAAIVSSVGYISYMIYMLYKFKKDNNIMPTNFFFMKLSDWQWMKEQVIVKGMRKVQ